MKFNCISDNFRLVERLNKAVKEGRVSHAYIFEGPAFMDMLDFAVSFAKGVLCPDGIGENCGRCSLCDKIDHDNHEDIIYIDKDGLSIKDEAIETMQERLNIKPLGDRNIVIINNCDTMTERAQNRLLKTLEEPPGQSVIILISNNMQNMTQTILSRCVKYRIEGKAEEEDSAKSLKIVEMILHNRPFYEINSELSNYVKDREKAEKLLDLMENTFMNIALGKSEGLPSHKFEEVYESIHEIEHARANIRRKMAPGYALKNLVLKITG